MNYKFIEKDMEPFQKNNDLLPSLEFNAIYPA